VLEIFHDGERLVDDDVAVEQHGKGPARVLGQQLGVGVLAGRRRQQLDLVRQVLLLERELDHPRRG
jgi:hypothetical protein